LTRTLKARDLATFLATRRGIYLSTLVLLLVFVLLSCYRAYPYVDDVNEANSGRDDWISYKMNALSVLHDGLSMPAVKHNYHLPGGFLYNYFLAGLFALFGENSAYVYLFQAGLLALAVGLTAIAFKPLLPGTTAAIYFWALALGAFLDVFWFYTFRLLSENLVLFLLPIFYLLILKTVKRESTSLASFAGVALGLCVLCRQNLILLGPGITVLLFIYLKGRPRRALISLSFLVWAGLTFSLLPLRNYAVTGEISVPVIHYSAQRLTSNVEINEPITPASIAGKILFCAGITTAMGLPLYYLKPHWLVMWIAALIYSWRLLKSRRLEFWQAFAFVFILVYLTPLLGVPGISNYGVRMVVPVMPMVLLLGVSSLTPRAAPH
jgi:hypothetical protein